MTMPAVLDGYIDRPTLAGQLKKSERTLERWERERIGPPITRIGKTVFYRLEALYAWLREQEQKPLRTSRGVR